MDPRLIEHQHKRKDFEYIIVDTDVGGDDCQALITLFHMCKKYNKKLLGITVINGNAIIKDVIENTLITLAMCNEKYPIYAGNNSSIAGQNQKDYYFGLDGLGQRQSKYSELLKDKIDRSLLQKEKAYHFIAQSALKYRGKIAFISLGPLTNLAQAYLYENQIVQCFTSVSIMGSSDTLAGLHTFYTAQFNIGLDPEASFIVFSKFKHISLVSLDTSIMGIPSQTTRVLFTQTQTKRGAFIKDIYDFQSQKDIPNQTLLCDPLAVLILFRPELINSGSYIALRVELKGKRTRGATLIDYFHRDEKYNAYLVKTFDVPEVLKEILESYKD